ncbi:MAG: hypothetical protein U9Q92_04470, partial [archaeon]|nr:hypothetical protein [archaeon]
MKSVYHALTNNSQISNSVGDTINSKRKSPSKGDVPIHLVAVTLIGIVLIVVFVALTTGTRDDFKEQVPDPPSQQDMYYAFKCTELCKDKSKKLECKESPEGTDRTCGEIYTSIKEAGDAYFSKISDEDYTTVKPGKKSFKLTGDFHPCSKMKITFHEDIGSLSDFLVKIAEKGNPDKIIKPANDPIWHDLEDDGITHTGYYVLCCDTCDQTPGGTKCDAATDADGRIVIELELPCEGTNFKPGVDYEISFKSADAEGGDAKLTIPRTYTKKWSCLKWASFPEGTEGIKFNQKSTKPDFSDRQRTKVEFNHEIKKDTDAQMSADIWLIKGDVTAGTDVKNDEDLQYDTSDPENPYYYFRIQPVAESLEEIRFDIKLDGNIICSARKNAEAVCQSRRSYMCYEDSSNKIYILHDGPYDKGEAVHTRDGLCYYKEKHQCSTDVCLNENKPSGCSYADLSVSKPVLCKDESCDDRIYHGDSSTDYVIRQTVTNIGDVGMKFKDDLATLTIQTESGGKHVVKFQKIINDDDD